MKSLSVIAVALLAAVAQAVQFTNSAFDPKAGSTFTITWTDAQGPVTIKLKNGPPTNLKDVATITSGQTGGTFTWTVPSNLAPDTYALEITDSTGVPNYSTQFPLTGTGTASTTGSAASSASTGASTTSGSTSSAATAATTSSTTRATTLSTTSTSTSRTTSSSPTAATTTSVPGAAPRVASPLALILVTVAAMLVFH